MAQHDEILSEFRRVLDLEGNAILQASRALSDTARQKQLIDVMECLLTTLNQGGKIILTGIGKSGKIAQKISATLASTGSPSIMLHPTDALHGDLGLIAPNDVIWALSHSGNTDELVRFLEAISPRRKIIGMGGNSNSKLAGLSSFWIPAQIEHEACPHNLAPTTSTTLALALGDAVAVTLMKIRGFDRESFAQNHPGGSLGNRLHLLVKDILHTDIPCLSENASMDEVVIASTEKRMGGVLIVQGKTLLGIITDGDIRRALSKKEKFFSLHAKDVMTKNPVTVSASAKVSDAVRLMENRPSQISVLPVVENGEVVGMMRIHDVLQKI